WDPFDIRMLAGSTMGILGYGDIGKAVARRGRALDMNVIALRRRPGEPVEGAASEILGPEQKLELIRRSDYLVVAAPLTPETRGWIGERELEAMKPSAVVINVGRGAVIEERALIRALEQRRIAGAALDVFEQEPLPASHPFYSLDNVLLSPHSADHTPDWLERAMRRFLENFARFERGEPLVNVVDKRAGY
ncbi:MAG: D-2-hydroxyacid dehydrogenase, partial [Acidobacteria bacterium]|nr:D-2-hydroxyacid dehydrogenase [Acidobacteriota bacterium]